MKQIRERLRTTPRLQLVLLSVATILLLQEVFIICIYAWYKARMFDGYAANGIFQLLDPLRRLYDGQVFGRDFEFFHGPFTALIHYPIFWLTGHNLYAASLSEWLISPLLMLGVIYLFMRIVFPTNLGLRLFATWLMNRLVTWMLPTLISPANSLLGVRLIGPVLIALTLWYAPKIEKYKWRGINLLWDGLLPLLIAFALLNGTEFGLASLGASLIVYFIFQKRRWYLRILPCLRLLALSIVFLIGLAALLSHGAPFSILKYSFVDVPADQFWYFGTPPNPFLTSIGQVFSDASLVWSLLGFLFLAACLLQIQRIRPIETTKLRAICFLLLAALVSLIPIFGYFYPTAQAQPMRLFMLLAALLLASCLPKESYRSIFERARRIRIPYVRPVFVRQLAWWTAAGVLLLVFTSRAYDENLRFHQHAHGMKIYNTVVSGSNLAEWWEKSYKAQVTGTEGLTKSEDIWSLYVGLLDAAKNTYNPAGYDYIIHALGPERRADYLNTFSRLQPEAVITLQTLYFRYEPWLENENWPLYNQLYNNYMPATRSDMALVWRKKDAPWQPFSDKWENVRPILGPEQKQMVVPLPGSAAKRDFKLYTFEVEYDASYKLAKLPYVGKMPRFLVAQSGLNAGPAVSLPPYQNKFSFPVLVRGNDEQVVFNFTTYALTPGAHLQMKTLKWRQEHVSPDMLQTRYADWVTVDIKKPTVGDKR